VQGLEERAEAPGEIQRRAQAGDGLVHGPGSQVGIADGPLVGPEIDATRRPRRAPNPAEETQHAEERMRDDRATPVMLS
jgi:hypothetical protein